MSSQGTCGAGTKGGGNPGRSRDPHPDPNRPNRALSPRAPPGDVSTYHGARAAGCRPDRESEGLGPRARGRAGIERGAAPGAARGGAGARRGARGAEARRPPAQGSARQGSGRGQSAGRGGASCLPTASAAGSPRRRGRPGAKGASPALLPVQRSATGPFLLEAAGGFVRLQNASTPCICYTSLQRKKECCVALPVWLSG